MIAYSLEDGHRDGSPSLLGCGCHDASAPSAELLLALEFAERGQLPEPPARKSTPRVWLTVDDFALMEPRILGRLADLFALMEAR